MKTCQSLKCFSIWGFACFVAATSLANSPTVLPPSIPGDSRPVLLLGGIESVRPAAPTDTLSDLPSGHPVTAPTVDTIPPRPTVPEPRDIPVNPEAVEQRIPDEVRAQERQIPPNLPDEKSADRKRKSNEDDKAPHDDSTREDARPHQKHKRHNRPDHGQPKQRQNSSMKPGPSSSKQGPPRQGPPSEGSASAGPNHRGPMGPEPLRHGPPRQEQLRPDQHRQDRPGPTHPGPLHPMQGHSMHGHSMQGRGPLRLGGMDNRIELNNRGPRPDWMIDSPIMQKLISLIQENSELKSRLRIQEIEMETKMRIHQLEEKLAHSEAAYREAIVAKEHLASRIAELEHRSRLLEPQSESPELNDHSSVKDLRKEVEAHRQEIIERLEKDRQQAQAQIKELLKQRTQVNRQDKNGKEKEEKNKEEKKKDE